MLGHRGTTDRQLARELSDRTRPFRETLEDRAPRRVTERGPGVGLVNNPTVSIGLRAVGVKPPPDLIGDLGI